MRVPILKALVMLLSLGICAQAQVNRELDALEGVGIDEKLSAQLPLDLEFVDANGKQIRLADLFDGERAILLSLNYSDCPMLCQLQLNGLVDGLRELKWDVGKKFRICSVSINPLETPQRAKQVKQRYVKSYGRPTTAADWEFLTGEQTSIEKLADAVGFRYRYVPERDEYAHSAAIMVCTPDGRVSRYLYGVLCPAQTLKLALVEAGQGRIGSTLDRVLLYCFHYDEASGRYAPVARRLMKLGAGMTLTTLGIGLIPVWLRRRHSAAPKTSGEQEGAM
ncbi:MAG: SCO family protein [Pseudomonadota bacterium]